jgi:hypothetical protein
MTALHECSGIWTFNLCLVLESMVAENDRSGFMENPRSFIGGKVNLEKFMP